MAQDGFDFQKESAQDREAALDALFDDPEVTPTPAGMVFSEAQPSGKHAGKHGAGYSQQVGSYASAPASYSQPTAAVQMPSASASHPAASYVQPDAIYAQPTAAVPRQPLSGAQPGSYGQPASGPQVSQPGSTSAMPRVSNQPTAYIPGQAPLQGNAPGAGRTAVMPRVQQSVGAYSSSEPRRFTMPSKSGGVGRVVMKIVKTAILLFVLLVLVSIVATTVLPMFTGDFLPNLLEQWGVDTVTGMFQAWAADMGERFSEGLADIQALVMEALEQ